MIAKSIKSVTKSMYQSTLACSPNRMPNNSSPQTTVQILYLCCKGSSPASLS